jgi:acylglycerol kinase
VTGLLRRADGDLAVQRKFPVGVLPLGRTNTLATSLFFDSDKVNMMAEATMAIIKEITKPIDVIKIEVLEVSILLQEFISQLLFYCFSYHICMMFLTLQIQK